MTHRWIAPFPGGNGGHGIPRVLTGEYGNIRPVHNDVLPFGNSNGSKTSAQPERSRFVGFVLSNRFIVRLRGSPRSSSRSLRCLRYGRIVADRLGAVRRLWRKKVHSPQIPPICSGPGPRMAEKRDAGSSPPLGVLGCGILPGHYPPQHGPIGIVANQPLG